MKSDFPIDNKPELRNCPFCGNEAFQMILSKSVSAHDFQIKERIYK